MVAAAGAQVLRRAVRQLAPGRYFGLLYFRPNFFANTPDILAPILQEGGPPAFKARFASSYAMRTLV